MVKSLAIPYEPLIQVQQMRSTFHPHAQRNAFRRCAARQQRRLFARWHPRLIRIPNSNRLCRDVSYDFPVVLHSSRNALANAARRPSRARVESVTVSISLQNPPVRIAVRPADLAGWAVFEFQNRMNFPIVFASEGIVEKMIRVEQKQSRHPHE